MNYQIVVGGAFIGVYGTSASAPGVCVCVCVHVCERECMGGWVCVYVCVCVCMCEHQCNTVNICVLIQMFLLKSTVFRLLFRVYTKEVLYRSERLNKLYRCSVSMVLIVL